MTKTIHIKGIMCAHCEMRVKKALEALPFISGAQVSHDTGTAVVETDDRFSADSVRQAVTDAGYEFVSVD